MNRKKILVTGATGHVGFETVMQLLRLGRPVVATDLAGADWSAYADVDVEQRKADLVLRRAWDDVLDGVSGVIHTVGLIDISRPWEQLLAVNFTATRHMLEACARNGIRRTVFLSSASVCGAPSDYPISEDSFPRPKNDYERTKVMAEYEVLEYAQKSDLEVCILRPSVVYGPRGRLLSTTAVVLGCLLRHRGMPVPLIRGGPRCNWVHARDVARAAIFLLDHGRNGERYHAANDDPLTLGEMVGLTFTALGVPMRGGIGFPYRAARFAARNPIPESVFGSFNNHLRRRWSGLARTYSLAHGFDGSIVQGIFEYGLGDYVFSNDRIKALGFRLEHPKLEPGWIETIRWYQRMRWIPE